MKGNLSAFLYGMFVLWTFLIVLGWIMVRSLKNSTDPGRLISKWILTLVIAGIAISVAAGSRLDDMGSAFIIPITAAVCGVCLGLVWGSSIGEIMAGPIVSLFDGGTPEGEFVPLYSIAHTRRKQGRFADAIIEVRKQLDQFPEDFEGWMLLAEIQAENKQDNNEAQQTIEEILQHPSHKPEQIAYALTRSAEWHLKLVQDRDAARASFQRIIDLFPDTEVAHLAAQRIAHLVPQEMLESKGAPQLLPVARHTEKLGLQGKVVEVKAEDFAATARRLVHHLEQHPLDNEAREQLALVYGNEYHRLDLAKDQLEQLISSPHQQAKHVVKWLNMLADLQIRLDAGPQAARDTLQRIIDLYPKSAGAESAIKRIAYLKLELKPNQKQKVVKLGAYEQNLGLKGGRRSG